MNEFPRWLKTNGLSESTITKYKNAVFSSLSKWAIGKSITKKPLADILNLTEFDSVSKIIQAHPEFINKDLRGHNMYSNALNRYSEFLSERQKK